MRVGKYANGNGIGRAARLLCWALTLLHSQVWNLTGAIKSLAEEAMWGHFELDVGVKGRVNGD